MKNYLGIDWGTVKVGVALAHAETGLAVSYETLLNDENLLKKIGEIIEKEEVGTVVVGVPVYHGREEEGGEKKFGACISEQFRIPVVYVNEMFTSKISQQNLAESGKKRVSQQDDKEAARILLQEWLDHRK